MHRSRCRYSRCWLIRTTFFFSLIFCSPASIGSRQLGTYESDYAHILAGPATSSIAILKLDSILNSVYGDERTQSWNAVVTIRHGRYDISCGDKSMRLSLKLGRISISASDKRFTYKIKDHRPSLSIGGSSDSLHLGVPNCYWRFDFLEFEPVNTWQWFFKDSVSVNIAGTYQMSVEIEDSTKTWKTYWTGCLSQFGAWTEHAYFGDSLIQVNCDSASGIVAPEGVEGWK